MKRRDLLALAPLVLTPGIANAMMTETENQERVISDFRSGEPLSDVPGKWSGYSDRVMGGVSDAKFEPDVIDGLGCIRLRGRVTRDSGGGFIQMARYMGEGRSGFDASAYKGLEVMVYGNDEDYNIHIRTGDVRWYEQSYRATFKAKPAWQIIRLDWSDFVPNEIDAPIRTGALQRIGLLGWMREFQADLALARMAFYA